MHNTENIKKILKTHPIYELVNAVAKRARQITNDAILDNVLDDRKSIDIAIKEFEDGKYVIFD